MMDENLSLNIAELLSDFPRFQVAFAVILGMTARPGDCPGIETLAREAETAATDLVAQREVAELVEIQDWRAAYRAFGSKKTSYRNSCEALLRRVRGGAGLPRVSPLVDLYNALSIKYLIPAGADDLARLVPPLAFRFARPGDSFLDLAKDPPENDPPVEGEVVYADAEKCLCRRWNWRQDARSRVRAETVNAAVVLQTLDPNGTARLTEAAAELAAHAGRDLGASCHWAIASADSPTISLPLTG